MRKITLKFKTKKGENAYKELDKKGKQESYKNKLIVKGFYKEKTINHDPLTIEIKIKIPWLAVQVNLDQQIKTKLKELGLQQSIDYTIKVE